ncbi:hypothetical protein HELRODRAFT_182904 [Helobdella robusta]|uniref:Uncharacterized protein n=1 Tax=Helobdella robusta TaxID=6412 RepID=T1FIW8_HELRO|nr:hypothetical protein HELRODRAFT_182904 [Helobdella robusta]ESN90001.1 hypothetical protein HELRODRAFT_182904 [Helobdella robusta]
MRYMNSTSSSSSSSSSSSPSSSSSSFSPLSSSKDKTANRNLPISGNSRDVLLSHVMQVTDQSDNECETRGTCNENDANDDDDDEIIIGSYDDDIHDVAADDDDDVINLGGCFRSGWKRRRNKKEFACNGGWTIGDHVRLFINWAGCLQTDVSGCLQTDRDKNFRIAVEILLLCVLPID